MDKYIKYEDIRECRFFQDERGEWILHTDIIKIPAADVAPVRHGRWIERHGKWIDELDPWDRQHIGKCSECGKRYCDYMYFRFCPNCGADMRDNTQKTSVDKEVKHG